MKKMNYMEFEKFHKDLRKGFKPSTHIRVNPSEVALLKSLEKEPNMPFKFYGRHLKLEKSSFSYVVELLEVKELITKSEDPEDRRRKSLELTEKGKALVEELNEEFDKYLEKRFEHFSKEDLEDLGKAYEIIKRLNKVLEQSRPKRHEDDDRPEHPRQPEHRKPRD
ncbi:MAG: winged helix DNA-binding protein [Tenericutes bacterium]|nr:winged helix DNA-binding protein [Mycoplasmatota bacterium]